jgi:alanine-synthesizing transaminase
MEFRRISNLPPYVFKLIDELKVDARRRGVDIIDLGFGNPDIPSPEIAVEKLAEAARLPRNHRYSLSRGIPKMREAIAALYLRRFGVELDPESEITNAIGLGQPMSQAWCRRSRVSTPGDIATWRRSAPAKSGP